MLDPNVLIALIVACSAMVSGVIGPLVLAGITGRHQRIEKQSDYARQDIVAARAEAANTILLRKQDEVAKQLVESNIRRDVSAKETITKLDTIHGLVNSNLTTALQSQYEAKISELALMREVIDLKEVAGRKPSIETLAAADAIEAKIKELRATLVDRAKQAASSSSTKGE